MTVLAIGILMTAFAVAIGGLALELVLVALSRRLRAVASNAVEQVEEAPVINMVGSENRIGTRDWAEEAAA